MAADNTHLNECRILKKRPRSRRLLAFLFFSIPSCDQSRRGAYGSPSDASLRSFPLRWKSTPHIVASLGLCRMTGYPELTFELPARFYKKESQQKTLCLRLNFC
jgi:hypothetical protein